MKVESSASVAGKTLSLVVAYAGVGDKISVVEGAAGPTVTTAKQQAGTWQERLREVGRD